MIRIQNTRCENSLFNAVQFASRAMNKDDARPYARYIYKENKFLVASDGHRLHYILLGKVANIETEQWLAEDGAYEIITKNKKEMILNRVENPPVFPSSWEKSFKVDEFSVVKTIAGGRYFGPDKALCDTLRMCPECQSFNVDYLRDVFHSTFQESWTVLMGTDLQPCLFKNSYKGAVVMPIKD